MGFGQYSAYGTDRKTKGEILAGVEGITTSRLVARNTAMYQTVEGAQVMRLHRTDVFRRDADGTITLDTGGWNTVTTRARMNDALRGTGFSVYTSRGSLYLSTPNGAHEFVRRVIFRPESGISESDGGIQNPTGGLEKPAGGIESDIGDGADSYDSLRPAVERYMTALKRDGIPTDTGGDPWVWPNPETGKYDAHYVKSWLADPDSGEPYVFGTFIWHALKRSGLTDQGAAYYVREFNESKRPDMRRLVCGKVRRYIRACLGYAA